MTTVIGYDVGGAHLKVARIENGRPVAARQIVCPLWQGMDKLDAALAEAKPLTAGAHTVAVTMTGELSDLFYSREAGVTMLTQRMGIEHGAGTLFWLGPSGGFGDAEFARDHHAEVASTNFLATAAAIGERIPDALLIDMGSTTTDIVAVRNGKPLASGLTDGDRLVSGELVYTGLTRTALMAIAAEAPLQGVRQRLVREYYATAADARRVLGVLPDGVDMHATADGRGTSRRESVARFARMFGRDSGNAGDSDWRAAAAAILDCQLASILDGARQVLSCTPLPPTAPVVVAGIGADVAADVAQRLGRHAVSFGELTDAEGEAALWTTRCAPAVAVALLMARHPTRSPAG